MRTGHCEACFTEIETKDLKRCANCRQVHSSLASTSNRSPHLTPWPHALGSPSTVSVSPDMKFPNTSAEIHSPAHAYRSAVQGMPETALEGRSQGGLFRQRGYHPKTRGISRGKGLGERDKILDERLDPCDLSLCALGSGSGEPRMGPPRYTRVCPLCSGFQIRIF